MKGIVPNFKKGELKGVLPILKMYIYRRSKNLGQQDGLYSFWIKFFKFLLEIEGAIKWVRKSSVIGFKLKIWRVLKFSLIGYI